MRTRFLRFGFFFLAVFVGSASAQYWGKPIWSDEFNRPAGTPLDPTKWTFDIGDLKVNHELEIYCPAVPSERDQSSPRNESAWQEISVCDAKAGNVSFDGEHLILRAVRENGVWTSGRIKTQGRQAFQYGRFEARIKLPFGPGIWPAFWALGDNVMKIGWPASGEIDFMESVPEIGGLGPNRYRSTIHGPGYNGDYGIRNDVEFANHGRVDTDFHIYGCVWSPNMIQFYVDDPNNIFFTVTPHEIPTGKEWVYNQPFFLILNLAIGSERSWSGATDATTPNPANMLVDWVRVYKAALITPPKIETPEVTMATGTTREVEVKLTSKRGTGKVYLDCSTIASGLHCELAPYVVDFSNADEATTTLKLVTQKNPTAGAEIKITSYTLSGDQGTGTVKVNFK
jgi:beta-glucanase (GH16 family)